MVWKPVDVTALNAKITTTPQPDTVTLAQLNSDITAKNSRLQLIQNQILALQKSQVSQQSQSFIMDMLTDESNGISFHRFQMFVWTLILGILFVYQVWYRLSMPEFDVTLLALLGISSGTYLGFKIPENN